MRILNSKKITWVSIFLLISCSLFSQTLYPLTKNLYVNIEGKYPPGYQPSWRLVGSSQKVGLTFEQYVTSRGAAIQESIDAGIVEYQGKTVLRFRALAACECIADFELPNDKIILNENPVKLSLNSFRKVQQRELDDPNEPCQNMAAQTQGGWKGYIILSADNVGNITMNIRLENYASPRYRNGALMYTWFGNNISVPNLVTPNIAAERAMAAEKKAAEDKKQAEIYAQKQAERKYLNEQYQQKVKIVKGKQEATTATLITYKGYSLKKTISLDKLVGNDISKKEGVLEAYQIAKDGYYTLLGGFDFTFKLSDYEPHERDSKFALKYCLVKSTNNYAIDIATYALIGDIDKLIGLGNLLKSAESTQQIIDSDEQLKITGYLKSKD